MLKIEERAWRLDKMLFNARIRVRKLEKLRTKYARCTLALSVLNAPRKYIANRRCQTEYLLRITRHEAAELTAAVADCEAADKPGAVLSLKAEVYITLQLKHGHNHQKLPSGGSPGRDSHSAFHKKRLYAHRKKLLARLPELEPVPPFIGTSGTADKMTEFEAMAFLAQEAKEKIAQLSNCAETIADCPAGFKGQCDATAAFAGQHLQPHDGTKYLGKPNELKLCKACRKTIHKGDAIKRELIILTLGVIDIPLSNAPRRPGSHTGPKRSKQ